MAPFKSATKKSKASDIGNGEASRLTVNEDEGRARSPGGTQSGVARSPSGISLSRPQSLFAPSARTGGLSPPGPISVSPSSRSIVDRTSVMSRRDTATLGAGGEGSAVGRLRRVASNASIASSIKPRQKQEDEIAPTNSSRAIVEDEEGKQSPTEPEQQDLASASSPTDVDSMPNEHESVAPNDSKDTDPSMTKRPLDDGAETIKGKQAKRGTWFGYVSAQGGEGAASEGDVEVKPENNEDQSSNDIAEDDKHDTVRASQNNKENVAQYKSWLPWRAPGNAEVEATSGIQQDDGQANSRSTNDEAEQPTTYTDSVKRYLSWGSQQVFGTAPTSPSAGWGWSNWRTASTAEQSTLEADDIKVTPNNGKHTRTLSDEEAQKAGAKAIVEAEGAQAIELDLSHQRQQEDSSDIKMTSTPATASPAQSSYIYRWLPSWNRGVESQPIGEGSEQEGAQQPTTPAEQYKAEALAHLSAKDAILNTATRSTWINYFSSRAAAPSQKMDHRDVDDPEVMRIEDGEAANHDKTMRPPPKGLPARLGVVKPSASGSTTPADAQSVVGSDGTHQAKGKDTAGKAGNADPAPAQSRPATPMTKNKEVAKQVVAAAQKVKDSTLANANARAKATAKAAPNLLLPSFEDTFTVPPRSVPLKTGVWEKTMSILFSKDSDKQPTASTGSLSSFSKPPPSSLKTGQQQARLPRLWSTMGDKERETYKGCKDVRKVTVIGIHGWFSQGPIRNLFGEPTGTSSKFATMMTDAVKRHLGEAGVTISDENITSIALQADGLVSDRVDKSFAALLANSKWVKDLAASDAIFVAAHSQGSIVATHLLARLVEQRHIDTRRSRTVLLCMCGIHNGPFAHLRGSISSYYMSTFETPAARELFEFQNGQTPVSRLYAASLRMVCAAGVKLVYVASLDDQVVPLFSALHTSASHPSILRAIFCDGAAFPRVDFLTNLLSFCVNVRNAGLWDHHLVTLLSSSVAGSLYGGLGHSLVYDDLQVYSLAVRYLFEVTSPLSWPTARSGRTLEESARAGAVSGVTASYGVPSLDLDEEFNLSRNQKWNSNPYSLPWSLRGLLEDNLVRHYFSAQIDKLIRDYSEWQPSTKTLKDVQFRLEPMRLIAGELSPGVSGKKTNPQQTLTTKTSNSKL